MNQLISLAAFPPPQMANSPPHGKDASGAWELSQANFPWSIFGCVLVCLGWGGGERSWTLGQAVS